MTTIAESTFTPAQAIDNIVDTAVAVGAPWSEPESGTITNDQTDTSWRNNGRLLYHADAGVYILLYVTYGETFNQHAPIRLVYSNDWNSTENIPSGKTTVTSDDPFSGDVGNFQSESYNTHNQDEVTGIFALNDEAYRYNPATVNDRIDAATNIQMTMFGSVGTGHLTVGTWNTTDSQNGACNYHAWEYVNNKFWNDGTDPWAFVQTNQQGPEHFGGYGWEAKDNRTDVDEIGGHGCFGYEDAWGFINPDTSDDTYFFKRPVIYQTDSTTVPVAYYDPAILSDKDEGGAHGDIITYDGVDHRIMQQSGDSTTTTVSIGLRYT